jgi:Rrf2 family protein
MQLTKYGEYALRAMAHLSGQPPATIVKIGEISSEWDVPENILRQIIPKLVKAGYIRTVRGREGGILLNLPPSRITVLDVIEAIEGPLVLNQCLENVMCTRGDYCPIRSLWYEAQSALTEVLKNKTILEIAHS